MASDGSFKAKIGLNLVNLDSIPPFSETVEFANLNGTCCKTTRIMAGNTALVDVCSEPNESPKILILRPMSILLSKELIPPKDGKEWEDDPWVDVDSSGISRDVLATKLGFDVSMAAKVETVPPASTEAGADAKSAGKAKSAGAPEIEFQYGLGRPQFYFDGLVSLLLGNDPSKQPSLTFKLKDDCVLPASPKKKLKSVTVQVIAVYGSAE